MRINTNPPEPKPEDQANEQAQEAQQGEQVEQAEGASEEVAPAEQVAEGGE